jgi:transposase
MSATSKDEAFDTSSTAEVDEKEQDYRRSTAPGRACRSSRSAEGNVIRHCMQRRRRQEFIRFLDAIEAETPAGKIIHVILDNYGPHKHLQTRAWLGWHPRFGFHYAPTSASWLNAVEGSFRQADQGRLRPAIFCAIVDFQAAINRVQGSSQTFVSTADPERIIAAVKHGYQAVRIDPLSCPPLPDAGE